MDGKEAVAGMLVDVSDFLLSLWSRYRSLRAFQLLAKGIHSRNALSFCLLFISIGSLALPMRANAVDTGGTTIKWNDGKPVQTEPTINVYGAWQGPAVLQLYGGGTGTITGYERNGGRGRFSSNSKTTTAKKDNNKVKCQSYASDPVEVDSGTKLLTIPLFEMSGEMGLKYALYYNPNNSSQASPRQSWRNSIDYVLDLYCGMSNPSYPCDHVTYFRPDGSSIQFSGNYAILGSHAEIGGGGLATLIHNSDGSWTLHDEDATVQNYNSSGLLTSIKDASGVGWTINTTYTTIPPSTTKTTIVVTHTDGQSFTIVEFYNSTGHIISVSVDDPESNIYNYDEIINGTHLTIGQLTMPGAPATTITFDYTGSVPLLSGIDYNSTPYWSTTYDSSNRVSSDGAADGTERTSIVYATTSGGMTATITNPLGLTTTNTYTADSQGNYLLAKVGNSAVQGCGSTTNTLAWDANDNLTKTVDNDGITHTYSYAASGQLQTETEASGTSIARTTNYAWDPNAQLNRLLSVTIPGESKTSYTYNTQNRLASITRTNLTGIGTANQSLTTTYAYTLYGNGMVSTMTTTQPSPGGSDHTTYAYSHGNLTSVTDGLGHATTYSGYNALGEVGKVVGPNGDETDYTWDARGRVASKITHPNGTMATWTYGYDGFGLLAKITAPDGEVTTWARDAEQRVKTITHNDKDGTSTETFAYDANGDVTSDVISRGSDIGRSTSYVYDALGRVYQVKGSHGQVLTYAYDGNGNVLSVTDALGHKTSHSYDALDRVSSVTNAAGGVTHFTYDAGDRVTHVTDPRGLVTGYAWDGLGQLWQKQSPDTGTTNYGYDAYGRLAAFYRAGGIWTNLTYDALNRLTSKVAGGVTRAYTWDVCTNGKGRLCASSNQGYDSVGYSYSPEGWITGRSFSISGGPTYGLGYAYDNMGHLAVVDYPDGNEALYDYTDGAVADVRMKVGTYNIYGVTGISYRPMDLAMSNWTSYNGLTNTVGYDSDLRPTSISVPNVESLAFTYDAANRITQITNGIDGSMSQTLGYDAVNRLDGIQLPGDDISLTYDGNGNVISRIENGATTTYTNATSSNRVVSVTGAVMNSTFGYNADGDMTTINGITAYQYGPFDRLSNAGGDSYRTSAEAQRIFKQGASGTTYFAPAADGTLMAEDQTSVSAWLDYVWLDGRLVTVMTSNGGVYPVHTDQTGRPIAMTNLGDQSIIWQSQDHPFGSTVTKSTWFNFNIGFPGQYYDSESELWHNGNRDYYPLLARYIESDPIGLAGGVNTYAYVGDNPLSNVDPLGLCPINCKTVLPDGSTVGDRVAALSNQINDAASSAQMNPTPYGPAPSLSMQSPVSIMQQVYSGTNFKLMFRGQANAVFLGDAGNFAYGAVSANIGVPLIGAELGATGYALWSGHQDLVPPLYMDVSATTNVPLGYAAACQNP